MIAFDDIAIGDGATISWHSDRTAATVTAKLPGRYPVVEIQEDHAVRTDRNGMSEIQSYDYTPNPDGRRWLVSVRRGAWRVRGAGAVVSFGARHTYHDYSF